MGLQFFHGAAKNECARGNDFFTARFQAGYPDSVCFCLNHARHGLRSESSGVTDAFFQARNFATRIQRMNRAFGWNVGHWDPIAGFPIKNVGNDKGGVGNDKGGRE